MLIANRQRKVQSLYIITTYHYDHGTAYKPRVIKRQPNVSAPRKKISPYVGKYLDFALFLSVSLNVM